MSRAALLIAGLIALWAIAISVLFGGARGPDRLDPEPYRAQIRAVESLLYRATPAALGDGDRVAAALEELAQAIVQSAAHPLTRQRGLRLYEAVGLASGLGDARYALPDLGLVRAEWEKSRDALFAPAPWLGRADATTAPIEPASRPAQLESADLFRVRHAAHRLARLADEGEAEVRALGEPKYAPPYFDATARAQIEAWSIWARRWNARLDDALLGLPARLPANADSELRLAHRDALLAAEELRAVPQGATDWPTPFRSEWEARIGRARELLGERAPGRASAAR